MSGFARLAANVRFNLYGHILQAVIPFFFVPFALRHLGEEGYGLYVMAAVVTGQLNLLSFGAVPATVKYLAEYHATGRRDSLERLTSSSLTFFALTGLLGALLIAGFAPQLAGTLLRVSPEWQGAARFLFVCAAATFLLQSLTKTFQSVPQGLHRFEWWNAAEAAGYLLQYGGAVALLACGRGLRSLAAWYVAAALFSLALYVSVARRLLPDVRLRFGWDAEMARRLVTLGGFLFLAQLCWSVLHQADKIVLGHYIPMRELTIYLVIFTLGQKLHIPMTPVTPVLIPFYSSLHGQGDLAGARRAYLGGMKLTLVLVGPVAVLAFLLLPAFLRLWLGWTLTPRAAWLARALVAGSFCSVLLTFPNTLAQGFANVRTFTLVYAALSAAAAGSWFWVLPRHGALGAALVFAAFQGIFALFFLGWCHRVILGIADVEFVRAMLRPVLLNLPLLLAGLALRDRLQGWLSLGGFGLAAYAATLAASYRWAFDAEERRRFREVF